MRKKRNFKREINPDSRYNNTVIAKFINYVMKEGRKSTAEQIVYDALDSLEKEKGKDPMEIFTKALDNISPLMEVKSKRIGGANYQVPRLVRGERKLSLSFRWLLGAARSRKGQPMAKKLAAELWDAYQNTGSAIKKKEDTHRMAEANKAFAHFG